MPSYVIAGASLAGAKAAETLRDEGFDGDIVLIGSESERPYERPPLSKGYLLGSDQRDSVYVHAAGWYDEHNVGLIEGITVTEIDPGAHVIATTGPAGALDMSYDKLLLATGASPRRLNSPRFRPRGGALPPHDQKFKKKNSYFYITIYKTFKFILNNYKYQSNNAHKTNEFLIFQ